LTRTKNLVELDGLGVFLTDSANRTISLTVLDSTGNYIGAGERQGIPVSATFGKLSLTRQNEPAVLAKDVLFSTPLDPGAHVENFGTHRVYLHWVLAKLGAVRAAGAINGVAIEKTTVELAAPGVMTEKPRPITVPFNFYCAGPDRDFPVWRGRIISAIAPTHLMIQSGAPGGFGSTTRTVPLEDSLADDGEGNVEVPFALVARALQGMVSKPVPSKRVRLDPHLLDELGAQLEKMDRPWD
jgi:hypothetical protein